MVFAGFFISSARYVSITVESTPPPDAVFVTGNFDVSGATLTYKDQLVVVPTDIEFKTDGTKLFVAIQGSLSIYEYSMSNAWDLTTVSADATTSLSVSNMSQVQTIDFNRDGTKLYACGSGNVAEFSLSSGYDLSTAGSQSTLDISVYTGPNILGACFSNSVSNNYLHFTSTGSTGFGADPLIRLTFDNTTYGDAPRDINPYGSDPTGITFTQTTSVVRFGTGAGDFDGTLKSQFNHLDEFNQWGITIAAWVYVVDDSSPSAYKTIVTHSGYGSTGWRFYLYRQSSTSYYMLLYYGSNYIYTTSFNPVGKWSHYVVTIASNGSDVSFYMNGESLAIASDNWGSLATPSGATSTLYLMSDPAGSFEGERYMDDFCYFTRVLTADQVFSLYASYVSTPHYISTIEIEDPLSGSTFLGASANVVPLINSVVAPDLHTTRTLEVSGGGSRFYQIYRNTDLSNVHVVEYKLGTPHDASTLTSATQIEDYFNIATQTGGTALYDTFNSIKIKPDGTEMFLSGTYYYDANNNRITTTITGEWGTHYFSRNLRYAIVNNWTYGTYGRIRIYEYDSSAGTVELIHTIDGTSTNDLSTNHTILISESGTTYFNTKRGAAGYVTINDYDGSSWSLTQTLTITPYGINAGAALSYNEDMLFVSLSGYTSPVGSVGVWTKSGSTWSLTQVIRNPYTSSDSDFRSISVSSDNSTLLLGDPYSNYNSTDNGIVFVYSNVAGTWTYTNQTLDNPYSGFTQFAFEDSSLDINSDGTRAFVGSHYYNSQQGAVYIYDYNGSTWSLSQAIVGPVGTTNFGLRVSCSSDGKRLCVGTWVASGALVYIYDYDDTTWSLSQSLTPVIGGARFFGYYTKIAPDKSAIGVFETSGTPGYLHYFTTPKTTQTYSLDVPTPVLYISGDQDNVYDIVSGSLNVSATGTGVFTQDTSIFKVGSGSIDFDGSTSMLISSDVPEFLGTVLSISMWIRPDSIDTSTHGRDTLICSNTYHNSASGIGFAFYTHGGKGNSLAYLECWSEYVSAGYVAYGWNTGISNTSWISGTWKHVVLVLDGNNLPKCYLDGEELTNGSFTNGSTWYYNGVSTGGRPTFGFVPALSGLYYNGRQDEIKIFNFRLPEKTIKKMYLDGLAPPKDPVFHLTFEDNTGADILPSGASLGGTSLATLQSNTVTYQGNYVGDITDSNSNVQITNWTSFYAPFTFSMWLYLIPNNQSYKVIFITSGYWTASKGFWYSLGYNNSTQPYEMGAFIRTDTGLTLQEFSSAVHYLDYRWSHHTLSWDGSTVRIYVDGQLTHTGTDTESMGAIGQDITLFKFLSDAGAGSPQGGHILDGYVDDIRIYDYILDPQEVEYLYTSTHHTTGQGLYLSFDTSNVYDVTSQNTAVSVNSNIYGYVQDPGSRVGTHSLSLTGTGIEVAGIHYRNLWNKTEFTHSMWIFPTSFSETYSYLFVPKGFENTNYYSSGNGLRFYVSGSTLYVETVSAIYTTTETYKRGTIGTVSNYLNKWIHVVATYNAASPAVYINGTAISLGSATPGTFYSFFDPINSIVLGEYQVTPGTYSFYGAIDDYRVFDHELNSQSVSALYKQYTESRIYTVNTVSNVNTTNYYYYPPYTGTFVFNSDSTTATNFTVSNVLQGAGTYDVTSGQTLTNGSTYKHLFENFIGNSSRAITNTTYGKRIRCEIELPNAITAIGCVIYQNIRTSDAGWVPRNVIISGSNDGSNYTTIHSESGITDQTDIDLSPINIEYQFTFTNTISYKYYKVDCYNPVHSTYIVISCLKLISEDNV